LFSYSGTILPNPSCGANDNETANRQSREEIEAAPIGRPRCLVSNPDAYWLYASLDTCLGSLRRLIAKGDPNSIPLAERAINEYWDVTPAKARKSGLRFLQQDFLTQHNAVLEFSVHSLRP
jgi:hypothetical protein